MWPDISETSAGLCTEGKGAQRESTLGPRSPVGTRPATPAPASVGPVALCVALCFLSHAEP